MLWLLKKLCIVLIHFYRICISPLFLSSCRFSPSCSTYGLMVFRKYPFQKALRMTIKRISKCHPWGPDPYTYKDE